MEHADAGMTVRLDLCLHHATCATHTTHAVCEAAAMHTGELAAGCMSSMCQEGLEGGVLGLTEPGSRVGMC